MKFIISESQYRRIMLSEQTENTSVPSNVQTAYNQIISAVKAWYGTDKSDKSGVLSALNLIKTTDELKQLFSLFSDKKTGYSSFDEMINEEFDRIDAEYVLKINKKLVSFPNVTCYTDIRKNAYGIDLFAGGFKTTFIGSENEDDNKPWSNKPLEQRVNSAYESAKQWWINYLNSPTFFKKFKTNWGFDDTKAKKHIQKYLDAVKNLPRIQYYTDDMKFGINNHDMSNAGAFAHKGQIYYNKSNGGWLSEETIKGTMIHEIQHLLYDIHPFNPNEKVNKSFGVSDGMPNTAVRSSRMQTKILSLKTELSISEELARKIVNYLNRNWYEMDYMSGYPGYVCRETENISRLSAFRSDIGITDRDLTIADVKPYIPYMGGDKGSGDFIYMLRCWLVGNVNSLSQFLKNINTLAKKENLNLPGANKEIMS